MNALHDLIRHTPVGRPINDGLAAHPLEKRRLQCYIALILADLAALSAGFGLAGYLYQARSGLAEGLGIAWLVLPVFMTVALYNGSYSLDALERHRLGARRAVLALAIALAVLVFFAFYAKASTNFSRVVLTSGTALSVVVMVWSRSAMRRFIDWRCGPQVAQCLIIEDGGPEIEHPVALRIDMTGSGLHASLDDPEMLDRIGLLLRDADSVLVSCPPERRALWAIILKSANVTGAVIDDTVLKLGAKSAHVEAGRGWLRVSVGPLGMRARALKRLFDVTIASAGLLLLSPLMIAVAIAIKLEDGGPVLFRQQRVGRGNRFFTVLKFRSMRIEASDQTGHISTTPDDKRVTRVGRRIRRTSIDELPQLVNVLRGDMSIVGPRPHALASLAGDKLFWEIDGRYWQRHALRPGLTGLAQVRGLRGSTDAEGDLAERLDADLEYVDGWSLWRDCAIVWATLRVLVHERAY